MCFISVFLKGNKGETIELKKNWYAHCFSCGGYGKLNYRLCSEEWERLKEAVRKEEKDKEEIENIPHLKRIPRHRLWKVVRQTKINDIPNELARETAALIVRDHVFKVQFIINHCILMFWFCFNNCQDELEAHQS